MSAGESNELVSTSRAQIAGARLTHRAIRPLGVCRDTLSPKDRKRIFKRGGANETTLSRTTVFYDFDALPADRGRSEMVMASPSLVTVQPDNVPCRRAPAP